MSAALTQLSSSKCFDGHVVKYRHASATLGCDMQLSVFLPTAAATRPVPALIFLSGLTCNEDNFITKAGACQYASKHGVALVCPDTSPRGVNCKDDKEAWDFGEGASYYVDATTDEYKKHYRMYSYVTDEFYYQVVSALPIDKSRISLFGHSVGGHGALTIGLRNPEKFRSISAFAPMSNPTGCGWGVKAFSRFLGESDRSGWSKYDATLLANSYTGPKVDVLIDQGSKDNFLAEYLHTPKVVEAMKKNDMINVDYRLREGYDHGYWYIQTFVEEHIKWHVERLA